MRSPDGGMRGRHSRVADALAAGQGTGRGLDDDGGPVGGEQPPRGDRAMCSLSVDQTGATRSGRACPPSPGTPSPVPNQNRYRYRFCPICSGGSIAATCLNRTESSLFVHGSPRTRIDSCPILVLGPPLSVTHQAAHRRAEHGLLAGRPGSHRVPDRAHSPDDRPGAAPAMPLRDGRRS
ncbi:hypothetical protein FRACA_430008 [Frankia canadensis]|uniref:Uncharacterized protein n=1 Tax=Frankia canadensis TaxID=1836972 RepID=A0A2I2KX73_9ACTN|nr:hypothetical protein FRACA_430008 [Frankia canadensis]SOU57555.1 hypothetical protein FRACA_430008 [Frankia canadensis]